MTRRRRNRLLTALVALFSMLFMQFAVAAYACPTLTGAPDSSIGAAMAAMPDCDQVDAEEPALCHVHCQDVKSTLDKSQSPLVAPPLRAVSALFAPLEAIVLGPLRAADRDCLLLPSTSPPISIRHCCFRI